MEVKIFKDNNDIFELLIEFDNCFPHLKEKVANYYEFAFKLAKNANVITIQKDHKNVALCVFYANDEKTKIGYISLIAVKRSHRGLNWGKEILSETIQFMQKKGMQKLRLEVDNDNENAIGFYYHMGFKKIGKVGKESFYLELDI